MCCYKDYKHFERFNNLVQLVLHRAINFIESLPRDCHRSSHNAGLMTSVADIKPLGIKSLMTPPTHDNDVDVDVMSVDAIEGDGSTDGTMAKKMPDTDTLSAERSPQTSSIPVSVAELTDDAVVEQDDQPDAATSESATSTDTVEWSLEEKERLFQFVGKLFTPSFPLYVAYKHCIHSSLEDLSKQDACALNNYCELSVCVTTLLFMFKSWK